MNCDELLAALNELVDGTLEPGVCAELERHLTGCNPCQVVVDNIRQTITLYKQGQAIEIPAACRERLHAALRARWRQTHAASPA
jgi:RNA polymerase sigma-70 factor (ECF subfamily)